MSSADDRQPTSDGFVVDDISTGINASGFGRAGQGRTFSFRIERQQLVVEVYRPRLAGPVPQSEDIIAVASRRLTDIDLTDQRSLSAAVRDAVTGAVPVERPRDNLFG